VRAILIASMFALAAAGCGVFGPRERDTTPAERLIAARAAGAASAAPAETPAPPPAEPSRITTTAPTTTTAPHDPNRIETTVLQVNASFLTADDVLRRTQRELRQVAAGGGGVEEAAAGIRAVIRDEIRRQVERILLLSEANDRLDEQTVKAIDKEVYDEYNRAIAQAGGSKTALAEKLAAAGTTLGDWLDDMRSGMIVQVYVQRHLAGRVHITREMMWKHYQSNPARYQTSDRVRMQLILVGLEEFLTDRGAAAEADRREAVRKAREKIDKAAAEVRAGKDFGEVAKAFSSGPMAASGGVWPEMDVGSFRAEEVEKAAFEQEVGKVAGPIGTDQGFYLVKTLARGRGGRRPFAEVQDEISGALRQKQYEQLTGEYLTQLRGKATIVGLEVFERTVMQRAARELFKPPPAKE